MQKISLDTVPNQELSVTLDGQKCVIHIYQRGDYLFMDLTVDGEVIREGAICLCGELATGYVTKGFKGYLTFGDKELKNGVPNYAELGTRYVLFYFTEDEL